jgi:beta-glucosidase
MGVMASVKHFVLNNQETNRFSVSSNVDARTLWEIYYVPFEAAVKAGVASVMCSYNRVNGSHACADEQILLRDLKGTMGFSGWVMSDWGATHSFSASAGLDQEMPGCAPLWPWLPVTNCWFTDSYIRTLDDAKLDDMVARILRPMISLGILNSARSRSGDNEADSPLHKSDPECTPPACATWLYGKNVSSMENRALARHLASAATLLLKNDGGVLPIRKKRIAVLGSMCHAENDIMDLLKTWDKGNAYVMGGSGRVIPNQAVSVLQGIRKRAGSEFSVLAELSDNVSASLAAAEKADIAIICGASWSAEGVDRKSLHIDQEEFITSVAEASSTPIVVVTITPGSIVMPWITHVAAAVNMFLSGQETGHSLADVLFGDVNPSAKSPVTFPESENDVIAPCQGLDCSYDEGLFVGWRGLENKRVTFPFGHGLSYTTFEYSPALLHTNSDSTCQGMVCAEITIKNTGLVAGAEVAQLYLSYPDSAGEPPKVLRSFRKVYVTPGHSERIHFALTLRDIQIFNPQRWAWETPDGEFVVNIGSSSRDIRSKATFSQKGETIYF